MKILACILLISLTLVAQEVTKSTLIKFPTERNTQLKTIQERQDALSKEYQYLESQKTIVAQRAALELHLTAEQIDQMDIVLDSGNYVFKPKENAGNKSKDPNKN